MVAHTTTAATGNLKSVTWELSATCQHCNQRVIARTCPTRTIIQCGFCGIRIHEKPYCRKKQAATHRGRTGGGRCNGRRRFQALAATAPSTSVDGLSPQIAAQTASLIPLPSSLSLFLLRAGTPAAQPPVHRASTSTPAVDLNPSSGEGVPPNNCLFMHGTHNNGSGKTNSSSSLLIHSSRGGHPCNHSSGGNRNSATNLFPSLYSGSDSAATSANTFLYSGGDQNSAATTSLYSGGDAGATTANSFHSLYSGGGSHSNTNQ